MAYTTLITGTTSGIGKTLAEKTAQEGHHLILVSRNSEKLAQQKNELQQKFSISVDIIAHDLSIPNAAQTLYNALKDKHLSIDILINNAGFSDSGYFPKTDVDQQLQMIQLHDIFTTELTRYLLPSMLEKGFGHILNLGSIASYIALPYNAVYAASKAYILAFSKALHYELKGSGVSVTCLCPGATQTEFAQKAKMEENFLFKYLAMSPEKVADAGYKAMMQQKTVVIPGVHNKLMVASAMMAPNWLVNWITNAVAKPK